MDKLKQVNKDLGETKKGFDIIFGLLCHCTASIQRKFIKLNVSLLKFGSDMHASVTVSIHSMQTDLLLEGTGAVSRGPAKCHTNSMVFVGQKELPTGIF